MCPESIPTVSIVSRCPENANEWKRAAERKKCEDLGKVQSCTEAEKFMYHCVLNREATMLLEVCAPMYYMPGYCARFSELHKGIINDPGLDCTKFDPPCPPRFKSNESYLYQMCYSKRSEIFKSTSAFQLSKLYQANQQEKDEASATAAVLAFLVIFVLITVSLIIFIFIGYKRKWIKFTFGKKTSEDQKDDIESVEVETLIQDSFQIEDQTAEAEEIEVPDIHTDPNEETIEHYDERRRLVEEKCDVGDQIDENQSKECIAISDDVENDRFPFKDEKEKYVYFWRKDSVFSQWYPSTFVIGDVEYNCAEQYMMHKKAELMGDVDRAAIIMALDDPNEIKKQGRHVKNFNQDIWESNCQEIVENGNMAKFSQNEKLKEKLISTYPKTLVEASPYDKIWGIGLLEDDPRAWNKQTWLGKNQLGEILTRVRERLRNPIREGGPNWNPYD